jgi:sugar lactone lactonase YvrE
MVRGFGFAVFLAGFNVAWGQPYIITTVAGGAPPPTPIAAINASLPLPPGVASDNFGNTYFISNNAAFKIDATGALTRVAGNTHAGYSGDGGAATKAQLNAPYGIAVDSSGNLYIADAGNQSIRKVTAGGIITTIAGTTTAGYFGDNGPAINAQLNNPLGVAVDSSGNLYIADSYNQRIRKVTTAGVITTVAGNGTCCLSGDNGPAINAQVHQPESVAVDGSGNLYIADLGNNRIRKVTPSGTISTVAGSGSSGFSGDGGPAISAQLQIVWAVASDAAGNLYIADANRIRKVSNGVITTVAGLQTSGFSGDGGPGAKAQFDQPTGVAVDVLGNVFIADSGNDRIRKLAASGVITTIAGDGTHNYSGDNGPATSAQMFSPQSVALSSGNLYVSDYARIRKIASGTISTVAGNGTSGSSGDSGPATSAQLNQPEGIALDGSGNLYIADSAGNRVRMVSAGGVITTIAGTGSAGYSGDGAAATAAQLSDPEALALDAAGNLYIVDSGNASVRKVTPNGIISTVAGNGTQGYSGDNGPAKSAELTIPRGIAVDTSGNLYIADFGNSRVRKVSPDGTITTVAVGAAVSPQGVAVDSSGNLFIADFNNTIWKVSPAGATVRIAGNGTFGYSGDGGSAVNAQLSDVRSVAVDSAGNLYLADSSNYAVRELRPVTTLLSITTPAALPPAGVSALYAQILGATGGTPPYTWSIVSGTLPAGLTLATSGTISGTPTTSGVSLFTLQAADSTGAIAIQSFSLTVTTPMITTNSILLQGTVGLGYSQTLSVAGGTSPYTWTLTTGVLPAGLSLSPAGVISGIPSTAGTYNFTVQITDAAALKATQSFTIIVVAAPPIARTGVFAHIAVGGPWTTTIYVANASANQAIVSLVLHADDGSALSLPMTVTQQGASQSLTAASVNTVIGPEATLVITAGPQVASTVTGWVDVLSSIPLNGFAVFSTTESGTPSEGTSPLQTEFESTIDLPYDDRSGFVTAVALANLSTSATTITATIFDPTGVQLGVQTLTLPANGHTSFLFPDQLPQTAGQQGIVQFQSSSGSLAGVGLRASSQGTFTSIPIIEP